MAVYYTYSRRRDKVIINAMKIQNHGEDVEERFVRTSENEFQSCYQKNFGYLLNKSMYNHSFLSRLTVLFIYLLF